MKNTLKPPVYALITACFLFSAFTALQNKKDEWTIPEKYRNMQNPVLNKDEQSLKTGKVLFDKHCKSCHGRQGKGNGPKAKQLDNGCADLTTVDFIRQSDGEIYYKIITGKDDMGSFKNTIVDDMDKWVLVSYIRTLKGK